MKFFLLTIAISLQLFAGEGFWQQLIGTEQRFYARPAAAAEANVSAAHGDAGESAVVDAKFEAFNTLITALKSRPFSVQNPENAFFRPAQMDEQLYKLSTRIRINHENGYVLAETRDRIAVETLKLRQRIFDFFATLSSDWTNLNADALQARLLTELDALKTIDLKRYEKQNPVPGVKSGVRDAIAANLSALRIQYYFYQDFLGYLQLNPQKLQYRSLIQRLQLGSIIAAINNNALAAEINTVLRYLKLDLGRLSLALGSILLAWLAATFLFFKVYRLMVKLITRKEDALDEMMLNNIENIRRPVFILILAFGLELGLEILRYPKPAEEGSTVFYFIYLVTLSYILVILIDNFFYHFLLKRAELKNKKMRSELVNLILSIIKIVVFVTAILIFLVHIDVNITGLVASLGIGGLAVALAAKDTLSNFFGLLKILSDNSFSQGDWIQAGEVEGTVVEIGFISTDIRTFDNALITVPNEKLANVPLKNYNRRRVGRRIKMHIGVTYGSDREQLRKAIEAIHTMLHEHPDTVIPGEYDNDLYQRLQKREKKLVSVEDKFGIKTSLMVYLDQLSASSMDILIYTFTNTVNWEEWLSIKQDIIFKIWEILDEHDLEFAFPSQSLYFDKDNISEAITPVLKRSAAE